MVKVFLFFFYYFFFIVIIAIRFYVSYILFNGFLFLCCNFWFDFRSFNFWFWLFDTFFYCLRFRNFFSYSLFFCYLISLFFSKAFTLILFKCFNCFSYSCFFFYWITSTTSTSFSISILSTIIFSGNFNFAKTGTIKSKKWPGLKNAKNRDLYENSFWPSGSSVLPVPGPLGPWCSAPPCGSSGGVPVYLHCHTPAASDGKCLSAELQVSSPLWLLSWLFLDYRIMPR